MENPLWQELSANKVGNPLVANSSVFQLFLTEKYFRQCNENISDNVLY